MEHLDYSQKYYSKLFDMNVQNYVHGKFMSTFNKKTMPIFTPITGEQIGTVQLSEYADLDTLIQSIIPAQKQWASLTFKKRADVMYKYREILIANRDDLAYVIHLENGKCIADAQAEIDKSIETLEFACSMPNVVAGQFEEVSRNVYCMSETRPLGIVSSITPFNFPAMVPHWTIAQAMVLGNAMVLKPSEQTPITAQLIARYWKMAGLPDGIFNIINGDRTVVEALCDHPDIQAISFVGSTKIASIVYGRATANNKRVIALGGAKNHIIIAPDVDVKSTTRDVISSAYGMVGQRCMAASVLIGLDKLVIRDELVKSLKAMKVGPNINWDQGLSPIINPEQQQLIVKYILWAEEQGAKILVDGRDFKISDPQFKNGYYVGPTLIDWTGIEQKIGPHEVFGPVLEIYEVNDLTAAIECQNASPYGNAASIFTKDGLTAFNAIKQVQAGMLGINIGVPVPREPFSFGGVKLSKFGHGDITGQLANSFWGNLIKITMKWNGNDKVDWMS